MKKSINLYYFLLIASVTITGCKKGTDATPTPVALATSTWTFNGSTYKVTNSSYYDASSSLMAFDDASVAGGGNYVRVILGSIIKPTKSTTLTAVDINTALNPTNCQVQVGNVYDTYYQFGHVSTGKAGDKVVITASSTGKLTASFSNITVTNGPTGTGTLLVSGTIIEN